MTFAPVGIPDLGEKLINHFLPLITDQGDAVDWRTDRLEGVPATSDCATPDG
ncbi:hypothetical protein [Streptomyces sp. NPDC005017]|uniref:hypothetical protein n=1 Tax=Streptomyces sp. NPDC005017 TaxID=3364706 RepID=UPI0036A1538F